METMTMTEKKQNTEAGSSFPYQDILELPHPTSPRHPRMSGASRGAQFSPFAVLDGYQEAVEETARLEEERMEKHR